MGVESYFERIERYLSKESGLPLIVDVQNPQDLHAIITHFNVGDTQLINANRYSKTDELPRLEALLYDLSSAKQSVLVTGIGTFLKLQGDTEQRKTLRELLSMSVPTAVVFLTYQCRKALSLLCRYYPEGSVKEELDRRKLRLKLDDVGRDWEEEIYQELVKNSDICQN